MYDESTAMAWLASWEPVEAPGRHTRVYPADDARGYRYGPPPGAGVSRAIPVDGKVGDTPPSWMRSPQARRWLQEEKKSLRDRILDWMKKRAA